MAFFFALNEQVGHRFTFMAALYLGQVFDVLKLVTNKERKGFIKDSQLITALQTGCWNYFQRQLMKYRAGLEIPYPLRPFKKTASLVIAAGVSTIPADFIKEIAFLFPISSGSTAPNTGEWLSMERFNERNNSAILAPSLNDPIAKIEGLTITSAPSGSVPMNLSYIRRPVDFVYAVTNDADGHGTTYSAAGSTDMEYSQECYPDIIREALMILGVKAQDQAVLQLGATIKE